MSRSRTPGRRDIALLALALLSIPAWFVLVAWLDESYTGWSELSLLYPAEGRLLDNSQGPVIVSFKPPGRPRTQLGGRVRFIETGFDAGGIWLRSTRSTPQPPLYFPYERIRGCPLLSLYLKDTDIIVTIQDQAVMDACQARVMGVR
ncbi:hypothetical protein CKO35_11955 [Ectothiorhodospira shaposhnikovii]|uniref:hypothetical protein n=1 Tax=Ectothiorhodospira shaposhnikovii TaxID=1054 RepID=UPI001905CC10|nr:hypothetical protein [Ectothiorhodospira shaposhnikovii]MBK1674009.1 hypothetical protein [Ectothiorhodospira shaposhnikovii]